MNLPNQIAEPPELATSHYWESRATTAELKIKEWSVRACEAEQRIARAREILTEALGASSVGDIDEKITNALDALEGK